jgi:hypothetical protein
MEIANCRDQVDGVGLSVRSGVDSVLEGIAQQGVLVQASTECFVEGRLSINKNINDVAQQIDDVRGCIGSIGGILDKISIDITAQNHVAKEEEEVGDYGSFDSLGEVKETEQAHDRDQAVGSVKERFDEEDQASKGEVGEVLEAEVRVELLTAEEEEKASVLNDDAMLDMNAIDGGGDEAEATQDSNVVVERLEEQRVEPKSERVKEEVKQSKEVRKAPKN